MRISDWSSDVCSSDLRHQRDLADPVRPDRPQHGFGLELGQDHGLGAEIPGPQQHRIAADMAEGHHAQARSEEHTSELQSLMRISYAVFCLKKKKINNSRQSDSYALKNYHSRTHNNPHHKVNKPKK